MTLAIEIKKADPAPTGTTNENKYHNSIIRHYAAIHHRKYLQQPQGADMGIITNDIKRKAHAEQHTTQALLEAFSSGQSILLSNFEVDTQKSIRFISASAFAIDVDDDNSVTDPLQVLDDLKGLCTGLFYTFSHGTKGNRYRLLFQLEDSITNQNDLSDLIDYMIYFLKAKGLPVDAVANSPTQIIRGGKHGYVVNNLSTALNTDTWLSASRLHSAEKNRLRDKQRADNASQLKEQLNNPMTFEELKDMCEKIGYLPSGSGDEVTQKWLQIIYAIKNQVNAELLEEQEGYELYCIVSGDESNERYWNSLKPYGFVTVGTIVHHAIEAGYKRKKNYSYALQETPEVIETEHIKMPKIKNEKTYIPVSVAKELIQRKQRLLIDSATGSGKTTAFINAFKELASTEHNYFIFAAPTRAIAEQVAQAHELPCIVGGIHNLKYEIIRQAENGQRIFISVYDKANDLINLLSTSRYESDLEPTFNLVIDEYHEFIQAYGYRSWAINGLDYAASSAISLIGLSGTPNDIIKSDFEKMIVIDTHNKSSPCLDYRVFTYDTQVDGKTVSENADLMLLPVIRGLLQQTRVLMFINDKERIQRIARLLKKEGIKASIVTSDSKQSSTYRNIVENESIADDIQVVLATVVIADGINIDNKLDWSCVVVADDNSQIFNTSKVKQISNRFRNQYRYFTLYMRSPNSNYAEVKRFNIETDFRYKMNTVSHYVDYLNGEFNDDNLNTFTPSQVEKKNGIFYKSTDDSAAIEFNQKYVRHESMLTMERYYKSHRHAFIKEVGRLIGHKLTGIFNVNQEVERNGSDLSGLLLEIEQAKEEIKLEADELRMNFAECFDEDVYLAFTHGDNDDLLTRFKKEVHADQYAATYKNTKIADYETCRSLGMSVKRRADINSYVDDIQALADIAKFEHIKKVEVTKRIFNELLGLVGTTYLSSDFKIITEIKIPKKLKVTKKDVKAAMNLFYKHASRSKSDRFTSIEPLNIKLVASNESRHINEKAVQSSLIELVASKKEHDRNIFMPAIQKKYGIKLD